MKTTPLILILLFTSFVSGWSFQNNKIENANSPSSKMFMKVHQALGEEKYDLADARLDSTLMLATKERDTTNILKAYDGLIEINFLSGNYSKSMNFAHEAISLLKHTDDWTNTSTTYTRMASIMMQKGELKKARNFLELGEVYAIKDQKISPFYLNYTEWNRFFKSIGKPDSSIHYLLLLKEKINPEDTLKLANTYVQISKTFLNLYNEERALDFSDKALALYDDKYKLTRGMVKTIKASILINLHRYKEAEAFLDTDDPIYDNPRLTRHKEEKNILKAKIALARSDYERAEEIIANIDQSAFQENSLPSIKIGLLSGHLALAKKQYQKVSSILKKTKKQIDKTNNLSLKQSYHLLASKYFQNIGDYKKANESMVTKELIQDSLFNAQRINLAQNIEAKYKRDQQDQQIANMEMRDELNQARLSQQRWLILGALFLASIFAGLFFKFSQQNKKIKQQNNVISKALSEKEVLLKEIHHRVKNNLQVISSLLGLQSRKIKDKAALDAINEGRTRVQSMSLIHQNLYKENNLTGIEIKDYLGKLCKNLFATYNISNDQVHLETNIEDIILDVDSIVPIGLILNELISNALKHAFPNGKSGIINIDISKSNQGLMMTVQDNGVGLKSENPFDNSDSFGYHLIKAFQRKLNADLDISGANGTSVSMLIRNYKIAA